jgi:galactonate dehydratase
MGSSVHVAAAAHLAAASDNFLIFEYSSTLNPIGEDLLVAPLHPERGVLQVPDGAGLGIEFDQDKLREHILDESAVGV